MAQKFNYFLTRGFDLLLLPFAKLPPFWGIFFLSLVTSLFVLVVYKRGLQPRKVKETKNRIKAHILAIRLYRDFWRTIVSSFFKSLYYTGKYFALNLGPLLLVLPLMFLLFVQMDIRYGMRPFQPGESHHGQGAASPATSAPSTPRSPPSPIYRATMNPVYIDALREVDWKLTAAGSGGRRHHRHRRRRARSRKDLVVGYGLLALSNEKMAVSSLAHFIYPVEKLLSAAAPPCAPSPSSTRPAASPSWASVPTGWSGTWSLTMIIALALKNKFGVEF